MKKWSVFFAILGVVFLLLSLVCVLSFNLYLILAALFSAISFFFFSSLCDRITDILNNQKQILDNQHEALENQYKLRVMISNLDKE